MSANDVVSVARDTIWRGVIARCCYFSPIEEKKNKNGSFNQSIRLRGSVWRQFIDNNDLSFAPIESLSGEIEDGLSLDPSLVALAVMDYVLHVDESMDGGMDSMEAAPSEHVTVQRNRMLDLQLAGLLSPVTIKEESTKYRGTLDELMERIARRISGYWIGSQVEVGYQGQNHTPLVLISKEPTSVGDLWLWSLEQQQQQQLRGDGGKKLVASLQARAQRVLQKRRWQRAVERLRRLVSFLSKAEEHNAEERVVHDVINLVRRWELTVIEEGQQPLSNSDRPITSLSPENISDPLLRQFSQYIRPQYNALQIRHSDSTNKDTSDALNLMTWTDNQWKSFVKKWRGEEVPKRRERIVNSLKQLLQACRHFVQQQQQQYLTADNSGISLEPTEEMVRWVESVTGAVWEALSGHSEHLHDRGKNVDNEPIHESLSDIQFSSLNISDPPRKLDRLLQQYPTSKLSGSCLRWMLASPVMLWRSRALSIIGEVGLEDELLSNCLDNMLGSPWDLSKKFSNGERNVIQQCILHMKQYSIPLLQLAWKLECQQSVVRACVDLVKRRVGTLSWLMDSPNSEESSRSGLVQVMLMLARRIDISSIYMRERVTWWSLRSRWKWQQTAGVLIRERRWRHLIRIIVQKHVRARHAMLQETVSKRDLDSVKWIKVNLESIEPQSDSDLVSRAVYLKECLSQCTGDPMQHHLLQLELHSILNKLKSPERKGHVRVSISERPWTWQEMWDWVTAERARMELNTINHYVPIQLSQEKSKKGKKEQVREQVEEDSTSRYPKSVAGWNEWQMALQLWVFKTMLHRATSQHDSELVMFLIHTYIENKILEHWILAGWTLTEQSQPYANLGLNKLHLRDALLHLLDSAAEVSNAVSGSTRRSRGLLRVISKIRKRAIKMLVSFN